MNDVSLTWEKEIKTGKRFGFGKNWTAFIKVLDEDRIRSAEDSLKGMLEASDLSGKSFLDIGSGSGLFSLAARRLGADVASFDYDSQSVACTKELKRRFRPGDGRWKVFEGSILDPDLLKTFGSFDIVYSWGVLHHTGAMWPALANAAGLVADDGQLFIAIYNDQGRASATWRRVKRVYVGAPLMLKWAILLPAFVRLWGPTILRDALRGSPSRTWRRYSAVNSGRGMAPWRDVVDWVGGYPFEVAKPEQVIDFFRERGFELRKMKTCGGGIGCNEYVFASPMGLRRSRSQRAPFGHRQRASKK